MRVLSNWMKKRFEKSSVKQSNLLWYSAVRKSMLQSIIINDHIFYLLNMSVVNVILLVNFEAAGISRNPIFSGPNRVKKLSIILFVKFQYFSLKYSNICTSLCFWTKYISWNWKKFIEVKRLRLNINFTLRKLQQKFFPLFFQVIVESFSRSLSWKLKIWKTSLELHLQISILAWSN